MLELGWSGLARRHLAIDQLSRHGAHLVAMHVAPAPVAADDELRARFALRAAALLSLRHPNLVRMLTYVADGRDAYWVTEAVQGQSLSALLLVRQRALSTLELVRILCDVLRGLECLHGAVDAEGAPRPIVHGSLSPASVLVSYEGRVKLDCSAVPGFPPDSRGALAAHALRSAYQAPECFQGSAPDPRSDLYAVGAMLWEGVSGRPLSSLRQASRQQFGFDLAEASERDGQAPDPELANISPGVLPALSALAWRALAPEPGARHQSARELLDEIEALDLADAFRGERSSLFGFMCNHFCEEHTALQDFLAERAPGVRSEPPEPEPGSAAHLPERAASAADLPERVTLVPEPLRRSIVPVLPSLEAARASSPAEGLEREPREPRWRRSLIAVSIAGAAALGVLLAQPSPTGSSSAEPMPPALAREGAPAPAAAEASEQGSPQTADSALLDERWTARRARLRPDQRVSSTPSPVHTPGVALPASESTAADLQAQRRFPQR